MTDSLESLGLSRRLPELGVSRRFTRIHDGFAAALQFSRAPDVASALIVGTASPTQNLADHAARSAKIPPAFWEELRSEGILHPDAAVPANEN